MAHRKLSQRLSVKVPAILALGAAGVSAGSSSPPTHHFSVWPRGSAIALSVPESTAEEPQRRHGRVIPAFPCVSVRPWVRQSSSPRALCEGLNSSETEPQRFERVLAYHRSRMASYRQKWEYNANSAATTSTKTPSRSWPDDIPSDGDLSLLLEDVKYCGRSPNFRSDKDYCHRLSFRVASALLMQFDEESQKKGSDMIRTLAEKGYSDAMVYYGMCLNEGRANNAPNSDAAVSWFKRCADIYEHPQSQYELGVAFYTGEGVVEDEEEAVRLFQLAAEQDHPAACYMLGDCLLDGIGAEVDRGLALEWLVRSAELGHRGARSRVMAVLQKREGEDYDGFTDASRQTLIEHTVLSATKDGQILRRKTTLRKKIGGGSRNPTELARRQTIISKSRKEA